MNALTIQITNLDEMRRTHDRLVAEHTSMVAAAMAKAGEDGVAYAKRFPRFTPRTGNLQRKTEWRTVRTSGGRILRLQNDAKYAAAIDKGARPHDIVASRKPYLHFLGKRGWVRKKRVKHPGNKPYRFLHGATLVANRLLGTELQQGMRRLALKF
jgi:hypothetical protein